MFYVYVLKSLKDKKLSIRQTKDLMRRFCEHNQGLSRATKSRRPFELIYYESFKSMKDAAIIEKRQKLFKSSYG